MTELVEWLTAILDREEEQAHILRDTASSGSAHALALRAAPHGPYAKLADIAAKRRILELHTGRHECPGPADWIGPWDGESSDPCPTILALATAYTARPGYRAEWAPT